MNYNSYWRNEMNKKNYAIFGTFAVVILIICFSVILPMGAQIDRLLDGNKQLRMEVDRNELVIDSLELMCRLKQVDIDLQKIEYQDLEERAAKFGEVTREQVTSLLNTIERLREVAGECYRLPGIKVDENGEVIRPKISPGFVDGITEEADKELENGRHHQTCPRPRVAHPKRTRWFSKDQRVGC
jgi:hypothetical protein